MLFWIFNLFTVNSSSKKPLMNYSYIIIDDDQESVLMTKKVADSIAELTYLTCATNYSDGLNVTLEYRPDLIFLEIDPVNVSSNLSLSLINELHRYLQVPPKIIVTTKKKQLAFDAIQYGVHDYILKPIKKIDLIKMILNLDKSNTIAQVAPLLAPVITENLEPTDHCSRVVDQDSLILCIKSYGDYRYIDTRDICYLKADNNSTDIHLCTGEMITAFKTLKHFEKSLSNPFIRIHNSFIINRNYIARIHTGNSVCFIKNSALKLPFSKSYKNNIDLIIADFANGNYLEI